MTQPQDGGPSMTLPNGETIREGEYGVTRDGRKVGPMIEYTWSDKRDDVAFVEEHGTGRYWSISGVYRRGENRAVDIIAKLNPVEAGADPVKPAMPSHIATLPCGKTFDMTNPYGTAYGLLDDVYGAGAASAMRAHGGPWQCLCGSTWIEASEFKNHGSHAWRVKPAPVVETITQEMWQDVHGKLWNYARLVSTPVTVTHTRTNGEIDNDSYKVEG